MDLPGILWCWRVGCRETIFCESPSFDARRGRNLPTAEGPLFANLPSWRIPGTKKRGTLAFFFCQPYFLGGSSFKQCLTWFTGWKWLNDNIIKILDARHRMSTTWNVTIQSVELFAVVASGAGVDGNRTFLSLVVHSVHGVFPKSTHALWILWIVCMQPDTPKYVCIVCGGELSNWPLPLYHVPFKTNNLQNSTCFPLTSHPTEDVRKIHIKWIFPKILNSLLTSKPIFLNLFCFKKKHPMCFCCSNPSKKKHPCEFVEKNGNRNFQIHGKLTPF